MKFHRCFPSLYGNERSKYYKHMENQQKKCAFLKIFADSCLVTPLIKTMFTFTR